MDTGYSSVPGGGTTPHGPTALSPHQERKSTSSMWTLRRRRERSAKNGTELTRQDATRSKQNMRVLKWYKLQSTHSKSCSLCRSREKGTSRNLRLRKERERRNRHDVPGDVRFWTSGNPAGTIQNQRRPDESGSQNRRHGLVGGSTRDRGNDNSNSGG